MGGSCPDQLVQLTLYPLPETGDDLGDILLSLGAQSVSTCTVDDGPACCAICTRESASVIRSHFNTSVYSQEDLSPEHWQHTFYHDFVRAQVVPGVTVLVPGEEPAPGDGPHVIRLDPRDAFGDGTHATTSLCAGFLVEHLQAQEESKHSSFLDAGTGSGILAIIASMLGVKEITVVEHDPLAIERCRENVMHNSMVGVEVIHADIGTWRGGPFKLVTANLLTAVFQEHMAALAALVEPGGVMIASGIGIQWEDLAVSLFRSHGMVVEKKKQLDQWLGFMLRREK